MAITNAVSSNGANTTTSVVTLPSSVAAGDLIIALIGADSGAGAMTWPSPWVKIKDEAGTGFQFSAAYLIASGGETSVSVTHTTERSNHIAFRIPAAEWHGTTPPEISAAVTGSSTTPDPPNLDPAGWATEAAHWIAVACADDSAPPGPITAYPTNYTSNQVTSNTAASAAFLAAAIRESFSASAENPGAFTMTGSETWNAYTIAVRPSAGGTQAALAGLVAGQSTLAGDLTANPAALLAGIIGGQSTLAGDLTPGAAAGAALAGVIGGISTLSAELTPAPAAQLAGIIAAQSGLQGTLFDPADVINPTISAIGNARVEIWGPDIEPARWDIATWDNATWVDEAWRDITPQVQNVRCGWGMDDGSQGILGQAAANAWTVYTYDPERLLDPANDSSSLHSVLRPGTHVQFRFDDGVNAVVIKEGSIDNIAYSIEEQRGQIRIVDRIGMMANAKIPAGQTGVPTTLWAAAKHILTVAGLQDIIWPVETPATDPPIAGPLTDEASVWDWLNTIALDCLHGVDVIAYDVFAPAGDEGKGGIRSVINFPDFTTPYDAGLTVGGATLIGIPIEDIQPVSSREGVFSQIIARDDSAPTTDITFTDYEALNKFGPVPYKRERPVLDAESWGAFVLADRAGAALQYHLGTLRPTSYENHLEPLFFARMLDVVHIIANTRDNGDDPLDNPISVDARLVGMSFEANTTTGWSAQAVAYVPGHDWT